MRVDIETSREGYKDGQDQGGSRDAVVVMLMTLRSIGSRSLDVCIFGRQG